MTANRRAIITGSTSGIGLGIATGLAQAGCDILLNGFADEAAVGRMKAELRSEHNVEVLYHDADVSKPQECRAMAEFAASEWGQIDILVNNAGIQHIAAVEEITPETWDKVLAVNLSAAFHLSAAVLPGMKARGSGRIVNVASVHGLVGSKNKAAYVAAKHGLIGLTKVIALETAGQGITCNAICPGFVLTPILETQIQDRMRSASLSRAEAERVLLSEKQPSGTFAKVEEVAALVLYLCSEAAASLTGTSLPVDGGWTAQ